MEHHVQPFIHHYLESLGPLGNRPSGLRKGVLNDAFMCMQSTSKYYDHVYSGGGLGIFPRLIR
jgi:hypothetical protein